MNDTRFLEAFNERMRQRRRAAAMASTAPITSITDPRFVYTTAQHCDIRATFERVKRDGWLTTKEAK